MNGLSHQTNQGCHIKLIKHNLTALEMTRYGALDVVVNNAGIASPNHPTDPVVKASNKRGGIIRAGIFLVFDSSGSPRVLRAHMGLT